MTIDYANFPLETTQVGELKTGDTFVINRIVYMILFVKGVALSGHIAAVCLDTGCVSEFHKAAMVHKVRTQLSFV